MTTTNTLQSLAQLLEEIGNIVINEDIAEEVEIYIRATRLTFELGYDVISNKK